MKYDLLVAEDLEIWYGRVHALSIDKLVIPEGRTLIIGPNASGKTSLIKAMLGLIRPRRGKISLLGMDPLKESSRLYSRVSYIPDTNPLPTSIRLMTLVRLLSETYGRDSVLDVVKRLGLEDYLVKRLGELSKGTIRKASLLIALVSNKELVVIDEPFSGLDSNARNIVSNILDARKGSLIVISHIPLKIKFDYLVIVEAGRITYSGEYKDPRQVGYDLYEWN